MSSHVASGTEAKPSLFAEGCTVVRACCINNNSRGVQLLKIVP